MSTRQRLAALAAIAVVASGAMVAGCQRVVLYAKDAGGSDAGGCGPGTRLCADACIAQDACCTSADCDPSQVCRNNACVACVEGASCTPSADCQLGTTSCGGATSSCVPSGNVPAGTACQTGFCNASGMCGVPGAPGSVAATAIPITYDVTTIAGSGNAAYADGTGTGASFSAPRGVALDTKNNLYVSDSDNNRIRYVTQAGVVTTFAGSGAGGYLEGTGTGAIFFGPRGLLVVAGGDLYVCDTDNHVIRKITPQGVTSLVAGNPGNGAYSDGSGAGAYFNLPVGISVDPNNLLYIGDLGNNRIRLLTLAGVVTTLAGSGTATFADGTGTGASFDAPRGLAVDNLGNVWVTDTANQRIRKVTQAGVVTTIAGSGTAAFADGTGAAASFNLPRGVAVDNNRNAFIADYSNNRIRMITPLGVVTTIAGSGNAAFADGTGTAASFNAPFDITIDGAHNLYVADSLNNRIRKLTRNGAGQLLVTWTAVTSATSVQYTATATATGYPMVTCSATDMTTCTLSGLASGVAYTVSVTATNSVGTSTASTSTIATPS